MRRMILGAAAAALSVPAFGAPALAATSASAPEAASVAIDQDRQDRRGRYARYYDRNGRYSGPTWRDDRGRYRCRKPDGTTGLLVGGVAGALVGRTIDTRGDRSAGTVIGAVAGALAGREIERSGDQRCN